MAKKMTHDCVLLHRRCASTHGGWSADAEYPTDDVDRPELDDGETPMG
jgi:hypothetical protein